MRRRCRLARNRSPFYRLNFSYIIDFSAQLQWILVIADMVAAPVRACFDTTVRCGKYLLTPADLGKDAFTRQYYHCYVARTAALKDRIIASACKTFGERVAVERGYGMPHCRRVDGSDASRCAAGRRQCMKGGT